MPLFDLSGSSPRPFRRLSHQADVYEREIEELFWSDLETFAGEPLFAVARQPRIAVGGVPDIVSLDSAGRVVVIEVKRDVDRTQLAQCLEYAGWARQTSLDELAALYHGGQARFFSEWQDFTATASPLILNRVPRLVLVARSFDARTESALHYLRDSGVPVKLVTVLFYEDTSGARILDVNNGADLIETMSTTSLSEPVAKDGVVSRNFVGVTLTDLLDAGVIEPGENIEWKRPQLGQCHLAVIQADGTVKTADGNTFTSLSMAADRLSGGSNNGWECWIVPRLDGVRMTELRKRLTS